MQQALKQIYWIVQKHLFIMYITIQKWYYEWNELFFYLSCFHARSFDAVDWTEFFLFSFLQVIFSVKHDQFQWHFRSALQWAGLLGNFQKFLQRLLMNWQIVYKVDLKKCQRNQKASPLRTNAKRERERERDRERERERERERLFPMARALCTCQGSLW